VKRKVAEVKDTVKEQLLNLASLPDNAKAEFKKRKLIEEIVVKTCLLGKGTEFTTSIQKQENELTAELLASGAWKNKTFKEYNFNAKGVQPDFGALHPIMKVRSEIRKIFLEMGFEEVRHNIELT